MIKSLKIKVLTVIMFFVTAVIIALLAVIGVAPAYRDRQEARSLLVQVIGNNPENMQFKPGGEFIRPQTRPQPDNGRADRNKFLMANLIIAKLDENGGIESWFSDRQDLYDEEYIAQAAEDILGKDKEFGTVNGQYYMLQSASEGGYSLALMDSGVAIENLRSTLISSLIWGVTAWILMLAAAIFLVNKMTKPIAEAFTRQKQFVSDAGHELKTPIAVIDANANVLEGEIGENKWLSYIRTEAGRMDGLVKNLMSLAEIEDGSKEKKMNSFDMSKAVMSSVLPFESLAFERGIVLQPDIDSDIIFSGNEEQIKQLVIILMSNAVKYACERGIIKVSLKKERKKIRLSVYNTGEGVAPEDKDKIFDRFYRADKARSRRGGSYGLGLAIAKAIVEEHRGTVSVESEAGSWVQFDVLLS